MSNKKPVVSKRLQEVWEWKEATSREVAELPLDQALAEILKKARLAAARYPIRRRSPSELKPA